MKQGRVALGWVLDQSGSMMIVRDQTIIGFNRLLAEQAAAPGEVLVSLTLFNTGAPEHRHVNAPIAGVILNSLNYFPSGGTALYDAVCSSIDRLGQLLAELTEAERPERVFFVIQTDGEENSSRMFTAEAVRTRIKHQSEKYGWEFLYLGAEKDQFDNRVREQGMAMGVPAAASIGYHGVDQAGAVYVAASSTMRSARAGGQSLQSQISTTDLRTPEPAEEKKTEKPEERKPQPSKPTKRAPK